MSENVEEFETQEGEVIQGETTDVAVISSRVITVVSTRGEKVKILFSGDTWGELKRFITDRGNRDMNGNPFSPFTLTNMKCVESLTRHTLEHPTALLPKENFVLFMMLQKSKSGVGPERVALLQEVRDAIANHADVDEAKTHFNKDKNFTNKSSEEIQRLLSTFGRRGKIKSQPGPVVAQLPRETGIRGRPKKSVPDMENEMQKVAKPNVANVVQSVQYAKEVQNEKETVVKKLQQDFDAEQSFRHSVVALLADIKDLLIRGLPAEDQISINERLGEVERKRQEQEAEEKRKRQMVEDEQREIREKEAERLRLEQEEKEKEEKRKKREEEKENAQLVGEFEEVMGGFDDVRHDNVRSTFGNPLLGDDDDDEDDDEEDDRDY